MGRSRPPNNKGFGGTCRKWGRTATSSASKSSGKSTGSKAPTACGSRRENYRRGPPRIEASDDRTRIGVHVMDGVEKNNTSAEEQLAVIDGVKGRGTRDDDMLTYVATSIKSPHTTAIKAGHTSAGNEKK
ncbi:unnamed protein product [Ectocarpus sp. 13 AM-2016]